MVLKHGRSKTTEEDLQDGFQRNCLQIILSTRLNDHISNFRLYEKSGSIPLPMATMRGPLRYLRHVLRMKDDRLLNIVFQPTI